MAVEPAAIEHALVRLSIYMNTWFNRWEAWWQWWCQYLNWKELFLHPFPQLVCPPLKIAMLQAIICILLVAMAFRLIKGR